MVRKLVLTLIAVLGVMTYVSAQNRQLSGTVKDTGGAPVVGATVVVDGTGRGTTTGVDGSFVVAVPANGTITVSFIGYKSQQLAVAGKNSLAIVLEEDTTSIDDVIVVAFGTTKKEAFTGSAAVVKSEDLQKHTTTNVADALVGSVAGLQMRGSSGAPGASQGSINIRGIASMYASTEPLVIVDGAPYTASLSNIPQGDIESVTVLKDAASAALYGARGASGVILVTTKRGQSRDAIVNVDMKWGVNSRAIQDYDVIKDPGEYYEAYYLQYYNRGINTLGYSPAEANRYANNTMMSDLKYNVFTVPEGQLLIGLDGKLNPNATLGRRYDAANGVSYWLQPDDWTDLAYGTAFRQEYNVSLNGGTDRSSYYASVGYLTEDGVIQFSGYDRFTARLKGDFQAKKWLKIGANVGYVHSTTTSNPNMDTSGSETNLMYFTSFLAPIYPAYVRLVDDAGNISIAKDERGADMYDYSGDYYGLSRAFLQGNPLSANRYNKTQQFGNQLTGTFTVDADFTSWLHFNATSNVNWGETESSYYDNPYFGPKTSVNGQLQKSTSTGFRTNNVQTLTFDKQYGANHVNVLLGHEYYKQESRVLSATKTGGYSPSVPELEAFATPTENSSYKSAYNVEGYFLSAQYNYDEKYYASASYRRDASSRFAKDARWGNFWSLGAAWLINREQFMQNAHWIDLLKLKLSYGQQGNDAIGNWAYTDLYSLSASSATTMTPSFYRRGNPDITWETTANFNAGLEFSFWKGRLTGNLDVYSKKTSDLLFWLSIPESSGTRGYYGNVGDIRNSGIELALQATLIRTKTVDWNVAFNISHNKDKILSLPEQKIAQYNGFADGLFWYRVGGSLYNSMRAVYAGVNEEGLATYWIDANLVDPNTGASSTAQPGKEFSYTTTNYNEASRYEHGSLLPKAFGGFNTSLRVGDFDFSATFDYQLGGKVSDAHYASLMATTTGQPDGYNFHKDYLKSWSPENPNSNIPRWQAGSTDQYNTNANSDRFLTKASYLNFQSFVVGYTLPQQLTRKIGIERLRFYVAGENLCFWSARKGFDPRYSFSSTTSVSVYSPIRTINGGLQITF